jgi:hypothetical protein
MGHAPKGWAGGSGSAAGASHCSSQLPRGGVPSKSSPCLTPTCSRLAGSRSEVVAPRTRARSSAASPQPKSLIEGGVASIMPMKRKDIPALLVSAPPLAPGTTPQPQLDRPTAPPAACPSPRGRSFPPGTSRTELGPSRLPARPQKLFGQAVGATSVREAVPSHSSLARGRDRARAFRSVGAVVRPA